MKLFCLPDSVWIVEFRIVFLVLKYLYKPNSPVWLFIAEDGLQHTFAACSFRHSPQIESLEIAILRMFR